MKKSSLAIISASILIALVLFLNPFAKAEAKSASLAVVALQRCQYLSSLSPERLEKVAAMNNMTVDFVHDACRKLRQIEANKKFGKNTRAKGRSTTRNSPSEGRQQTGPKECDCNPFEVCVDRFPGPRCVTARSSDNQCRNIFECKGANSVCIFGKCS